jgi:hypothetical protein
MTAKISTLLTAAALSLSLAAPAATAQDMGEQVSMLQTSVTNALEREGFDTSNVGSLTLNEIVQIKAILESSMSGDERQQVNQILGNNQ